MMISMRHSTHAVTLRVPYDRAFDYLADWRNQTQWAVNFVQAIREEAGVIIMTTPMGDVPVQWRTNREWGIIDMVFPGASLLPTRLTQISDELVYTFTISVPGDLPEPAFRASQQGMEEELQYLKRILEGAAVSLD